MFSHSSDAFRAQERRRTLVIVAVGIAFAYLILTGLANVWTDYLWFESVGFVSVWQTNLAVSVGLAVAGMVVVFAFVYANLYITERLSPRFELLEVTEDEELVERFREWVEPRQRWVRVAVAGVFALLLGASVSEWRPDLLLFLNSVPFGVVDPQFGLDLSFYMFRMPLWSELAGWGFNLVVLTLVLVVALHYLNGGIRLERTGRPQIRSGVKTHVSVLAALLALLRTAAYRLDAYELLYSAQPKFFGAGFTDVHARLPALRLLFLVSLLAAVFFLWNIRRPGWTLAIVSVGAWLFVSVAAGGIYPSLIQRFQVAPNELDREAEFISRSIEFTRAGYALEGVQERTDVVVGAGQLDAADLAANQDTIDNLRLWDPDVLTRTYENLQAIRTYYRVDRVDTDRYMIDGRLTQVMVAARELDEDGIPATDWQSQRLAYTHGFGAVLSPANKVEPDGQPQLLVRDIPPQSPVFDLEQSRIYFGETYAPDRWLIVRTGSSPREVDIPLAEGFAENEYEGAAGVHLDSVWRRLAYAIRYRDLNILISSQLRPDSRIMMERNIRQIVADIAPFLPADADPYPVILDGRIIWVLDLFTISNRYPYSQPWGLEETGRLARVSGIPRRGFNYIRNSVKATVDAFDGTVRFYVHDESEPLLKAWASAYPGLFLDSSEMPPGLSDHLRYPQDMFKLQSEIYRTYHMTATDDFFQRVDAWSIPPDPSDIRRTSLLYGDEPSAEPGQIRFDQRILPYYLMLDLPGDEEEGLSYALIQPFNPQGKFNMSSFLVAELDETGAPRLIDYRMPRGSVVEGTGQVGQRINQNDEISQQFTLWDQQGSGVVRGDMLVVPVEDSVIYVQPVYLEAEAGGLPEFRRVIVVHGDRIEWASTLQQALAEVFGTEEAPPPPVVGAPTLPGTVEELLRQAAELFDQADQALTAGQLGEYQRLVDEASRLVDQALSQMAVSQEAALGDG